MESDEDVRSKKSNTNNGVISRQDIQAAIAKTIELRALHASLLHGNSPTTSTILKFPSSASPSSASLHSHHFSAHDYPIFTPSYEDEPLPRYKQLRLDNPNYADVWDETILSDNTKANLLLRKGLINLEPHICPADDQRSVTSSCTDQMTIHRASPIAHSKTRRNSLGDFKSLSSCNKCKPAVIMSSNVVVPLTDSHISVQSQPKSKGLKFSWLFPKRKKKNRTESEEVESQNLRKQLVEANESRDAALSEASEVKSSLGELKEKLEYLETYCEELKKALREAIQAKELSVEEEMLEGFVKIVSESRSSVKQFCQTLIGQVEETDNLNRLLQPYKLSLESNYSKAVLYHVEAIINQTLFQDFENCVFQKNGAPKNLDPEQDRQAQFSSFVALRNLSWDEVLRKGTKYYSEEFSEFCDRKMSCVIATLTWTKPWPEPLLQAFFVAAKCVWLLHLLAFSFKPALGILRVEENGSFDMRYMDDVFTERESSRGPSRVKVIVTPGFYVHDRVLRCKVICRYKTLA